MLCRTSIRNSFLSKEVSNFNLKPIMETHKGRAWERKWTCSSLLRMPWSFWLVVVSIGDWQQPWQYQGKMNWAFSNFNKPMGLIFWVASCLGSRQSPSLTASKSWPGRHLKKRATRELQDVAGYANLDGLGWKGSLEKLQQSWKKMQVSFPFISMVHSW